MIIAISGTPGVGKSSVSRHLSKLIDANLISLSDLLKKRKIKSTYDKKRKTKIVTPAGIRSAVRKSVRQGKNIVDGHLSHFANADIYVILRCRPDVLRKRMMKRGWTHEKIGENLKAEVLDTATIETLELHPKHKVIEIDTTHETPQSVAKIISDILNSYRLQKNYPTGRIDWTEKYSKYLHAADYVM